MKAVSAARPARARVSPLTLAAGAPRRRSLAIRTANSAGHPRALEERTLAAASAVRHFVQGLFCLRHQAPCGACAPRSTHVRRLFSSRSGLFCTLGYPRYTGGAWFAFLNALPPCTWPSSVLFRRRGSRHTHVRCTTLRGFEFARSHIRQPRRQKTVNQGLMKKTDYSGFRVRVRV